MAPVPLPQKPPTLPLLRMFGLGAVAVLACVWALLREKPDPRQLMYRTAPPTTSSAPIVASGEIEIELWPPAEPAQ